MATNKKIKDLEKVDYASGHISVNDEYWQPTCVLKWIEDRVDEKTLYQKWINNKGESKYLELPIERR